MADETYTIDLQVTGVDRAVRSLQSMAGVVQGMGGGGASGAAGAADMAASFGRAAVVAAVVVAVIVALKKLVDAVLSAAKALQEFGQLQARLGSSPEQTAFLKTIGAAFGVDVGGAAARVRNAVNSGGLGTMAGSQVGLRPGQIDLGSAVNQGQMLMQALMGIRQQFLSGDASGALATARNLDVEDLYQFVYLTNEQIRQLNADAQAKGGLFGQQAVARAVQLNFAVARLSENWETLKTMLLYAFIPALDMFTNWIASIVRGLSSIPGMGNAFQPLNQALNQSTNALNANTAELRALNGIYGGGSRLRTAIPAAFGPGGGFALQDALRAHTMRLGSFSVAM